MNKKLFLPLLTLLVIGGCTPNNTSSSLNTSSSSLSSTSSSEVSST